MLDLSHRFTSVNPVPDPYAEEATAAFHQRALEAIDQCRDQGDQHPVVLLIEVSGPKAHPLGGRIARQAEEAVRDDRGHRLGRVSSNQVGFVFTRTEAQRVLDSCGRRALGRDFQSLFAMSFEPWKFLEIDLVGKEVVVNLCCPTEVAA
jgi:hypothetical protein